MLKSLFVHIYRETTCTLAQQFVAYLFMAKTDEECKTVLCSIGKYSVRLHYILLVSIHCIFSIVLNITILCSFDKYSLTLCHEVLVTIQ